jgi:F0F1-type ATP synthase assembly protein I
MTNIVFLLIGIVLGVCISLRGDAGNRPKIAKPSDNTDEKSAPPETARTPKDNGE